MLELSNHLRDNLPADGAFDAIMRMDGQPFRHHKHRRTIKVTIGGREYFIKTHGRTAWPEILKNALRGRWPVLTALPEWRAIERLAALGIATTPAAGVGARGVFPNQESFLATEALQGMVHLDELQDRIALLDRPRRIALRRALVIQAARLARIIHANGLNHRDFYLCHFMVRDRDWSSWRPGDELTLHLIDLHRMQIRHRTPARWAIKDISGLLFSSLDAGLTFTDWLRFLEEYWGRPWRDRWRPSRWWRRMVMWRAVTLYRSEHQRPPRLPARLASSA